MKTSRAGMTLFELLIVMTIIGVVYSIGLFTLKKERVTAATLSPSTLRTTLLALSQSSTLRLFCDISCQECQVFSNEGKVLTTAHLHADTPVLRYGFNRFGELRVLGKVVARTNSGLSQGCFEMSLLPDGSVTPLILKSNNKFYAYMPLGGDKPYITYSEEALRQFVFNETLYPRRGDDAYGTH